MGAGVLSDSDDTKAFKMNEVVWRFLSEVSTHTLALVIAHLLAEWVLSFFDKRSKGS